MVTNAKNVHGLEHRKGDETHSSSSKGASHRKYWSLICKCFDAHTNQMQSIDGIK